LVQDETIDILDQSSEWYEAMLAANIVIFEINHEDAISYIKRLENLENQMHE
jgi:hypothetical protein